jgi:hypothetical protein
LKLEHLKRGKGPKTETTNEHKLTPIKAERWRQKNRTQTRDEQNRIMAGQNDLKLRVGGDSGER